MMKKTLLCLAIGISSFYVGVLIDNFFKVQNRIVSSAAFEPERIFKIQNDDFNGCGFGSAETIVFSVIEGDYYSQENKQIWMYLSTTWEELNPIVNGDVKVNSKNYTLKRNSYLNTKSGELRFETKSINQVFYVFTGKISKKYYSNGEIALVGTLEKIKNRKVIEKTRHQFKFYFHICSQ